MYVECFNVSDGLDEISHVYVEKSGLILKKSTGGFKVVTLTSVSMKEDKKKRQALAKLIKGMRNAKNVDNMPQIKKLTSAIKKFY